MLQRAAPIEDIPPDPSQILRLGRVVSVDLAAGTCIVALGDPDSDDGEAESLDLPWVAPRAGAVRVWLPPAEDEQVLVLCPEGDLSGAMVLGGLFCSANPRNGDSTRALIEFADGAAFAYDPETQRADVTLPTGGQLQIVASGGVSIQGDVTIEGALQVSETVTAEQDVIGGGKSLKNHRHTGVQAGVAQSGPPA